MFQELKNFNCSLWFYIRFWLPAAAMAQPSQRPAVPRIILTSKISYVIPVTGPTLIYSRYFEDGTVATNEFSNYTAAKMPLK